VTVKSRLLTCLVLEFALSFAAVTRAGPASLVYRTASEVTFEVTSNGLARIAFQGHPLATGEWSAFNGESWFARGATNGPVRARQFQARTLEVLSPTHAVVRQQKDDLLGVFDYTFAGEDATISAHLENQRDDAPPDYRWLCPGAELAARFYEKKGSSPAGFETPDEFYAHHQIIPLVPVNDFSRAPAIKALQAKHARP
jgi:hypothetical protein